MATNRRPRSLVPSRVKLLLVRLRSSQLPQSPRGRGQPRASHTADDAQKIHSGQNPTFAVSHMGQDNLSHGRAPMDGWQCHCGRRRGTAVSRGAAVYSTFHAKHETDPREAADFPNAAPRTPREPAMSVESGIRGSMGCDIMRPANVRRREFGGRSGRNELFNRT